MKKTSIILALITALISAMTLGTAGAAENQVRIATDIPYKPMEFRKPDGSFAGFDIELGNALCKQAGLTCSWVDQEWGGIIPGLQARKYDMIMSSMSITDKREKHVLFTDPYIILDSKFFVPVDSPIKKIDDTTLKGKRIGVQRGTIQDDYLQDHYGDIAEIKRYQGADDMVVDLEVGRLDLILVTRITGLNALMKPHPGKYRKVGDSVTTTKVAVALRKNDQKLADKLNKALHAIKNNGTYNEIYKKYFNEDPQESNN